MFQTNDERMDVYNAAAVDNDERMDVDDDERWDFDNVVDNDDDEEEEDDEDEIDPTKQLSFIYRNRKGVLKCRCLHCNKSFDSDNIFEHLNSIAVDMATKSIKDETFIAEEEALVEIDSESYFNVDVADDDDTVVVGATHTDDFIEPEPTYEEPKTFPVKCDHCSMTFPCKSLRLEHTAAHHDIPIIESRQCPHCKRTFTTKSHRDLHVSQLHSNTTNQMDSFKCKHCSSIFQRASDLSAHKIAMYKGKYKCDVCQLDFDSKYLRQKHIVTSHGSRPYICMEPNCSYTAAQRKWLDQHRLKHADIRSYMCDVCGASFFSKRALHQHLLLHTGEMPYKCKDCDENVRFRYHYQLATHRRRKHNEPDRRKLQVCDVCGYSCRTHGMLVIHTRLHTGEKPYECEQCGRTFRTHKNYRVHVLRHAGIRPGKCRHCGQRIKPSTDHTCGEQAEVEIKIPRKKVKKSRK